MSGWRGWRGLRGRGRRRGIVEDHRQRLGEEDECGSAEELLRVQR